MSADEILSKIAGIMGKDAAVLVTALKDKDETTDEQLEAEVGLGLNTVRRVLYELYDHSMVGLRRTRDPKTGWYVFHWRLQVDQLEGFIVGQKRRVLQKLNDRLTYEKELQFYHCGTPKCKRVSFETATDLVFKCPKCGKALMYSDNSKIVEALTGKAEALRKELGE